MHRRRQVIIGLGSAVITGGIVAGAGAFSSQTSGPAYLAVVAQSEAIELYPANDPPVHVETRSDGTVSAIAPGGKTGLNESALSLFTDIVVVTNESSDIVDGLYFDIIASSPTLNDSTLAKIERALAVTTGEQPIQSNGPDGEDFLEVSDHPTATDGRLSPGESIPFGMQINLLSDDGNSTLQNLPTEDFSIVLSVQVSLVAGE